MGTFAIQMPHSNSGHATCSAFISIKFHPIQYPPTNLLHTVGYNVLRNMLQNCAT